MTLVRANWEPISKRYLQQAEAATDTALASSLYGSVAEFHLKYRPAAARARRTCAGAWSSNPSNRRPSGHLERLLREQGPLRRAAGALRPARRAGAEPRGAVAGRGRGRRALRQIGRPVDASTHFRKALEANPIRVAGAAGGARRR